MKTLVARAFFLCDLQSEIPCHICGSAGCHWRTCSKATGGHAASVNGIEMYYEVSGNGPPLVLLHGFGGLGQNWNSIRGEYTNAYHVIVPDLRGHGRSTNPTNQFRHRQSALYVYALPDHLGIRRFKAMGISTGGMALIHMATQQPTRVMPWS